MTAKIISREVLSLEEQHIVHVIKSARDVQEFLWSTINEDAGLEEWKRMLRKRVAKLEEIDIQNPYWKVEAKKRLLQTAAIAVNILTKIDRDEIIHAGTHVLSNLPQYAEPVKESHDKSKMANSWWLIRWWDRLAHLYIGSGIDLCRKLAEVMGELGKDSPSDEAIETAKRWEEEINNGNLEPWE